MYNIDMSVEIWKDILGYEGLYQASNYGRIRRLRFYNYSNNDVNLICSQYDSGLSCCAIAKNNKWPKCSVCKIIKYYKKNQLTIILKPTTQKTGYLSIRFYKQKTFKQFFIHRLVLQTFVGPCPPGMECRHLDGNPTNNRLCNLCWGTRSENQHDRKRHGTTWRGNQKGEKNPGSKLTNRDIIFIRNSDLSEKQLAFRFNVQQSAINRIKNRKRWRHI